MKPGKPPPIDDVLWDIKDIAKFLKRTPDNVSRHILKLDAFPKPLRIGHPRWYPSEVKAWASDQR